MDNKREFKDIIEIKKYIIDMIWNALIDLKIVNYKRTDTDIEIRVIDKDNRLEIHSNNIDIDDGCEKSDSKDVDRKDEDKNQSNKCICI